MPWDASITDSHNQEQVRAHPLLEPIKQPVHRTRTIATIRKKMANDWGQQLIGASKDLLANSITNAFCAIALQNKEFSVGVCQSRDELFSAFRLLYKEYLMRGYCQENASGLHLNVFAVLPTTRTLILKYKGRVIGTISLINDSPVGLPMESLFPQQIDYLRQSRRKIAEVGLLALDLEFFGRHKYSLTDVKKFCGLFHLFRSVFSHARNEGNTDLVIAMHPKHQLLYSYITFKSIGPVKSYSGACGNPALPMRMNIPYAVSSQFEGRKSLAALFVSHKVNSDLGGLGISDQSLQDLIWLRKDIFTKLATGQAAHLRRSYPRIVLPQREQESLALRSIG